MSANTPVSPAKLAANRANAQRSTGPRTDPGKRRAAHNATTHGLTATRPPVSPAELADYSPYRDAVLLDLRPTGPLEHALATRIALTLFQLDRAAAAEAHLLHATALAPVRRAERRNAEALDRHRRDCQDVEASNRRATRHKSDMPDPPALDPLPDPTPASIALAEQFTAPDGALARLTRYTTTLDLQLNRLLKQFHALQKLRRDHPPEPDDDPHAIAAHPNVEPSSDQPAAPLQNEPNPAAPYPPPHPPQDNSHSTTDSPPLQNEPNPAPTPQNPATESPISQTPPPPLQIASPDQ